MAQRLGHVHLKVRDAERAIGFYTDVFDVEVTERVDKYAFLSFGDHHHDVALQEIDGDAGHPENDPDVFPGGERRGDREAGLYHAAFEVDEESALGELYRRLRDRNVETTAVDHGISKALYFEDPSGNGLEAYVDTRSEADETWGGRNHGFDPTGL